MGRWHLDAARRAGARAVAFVDPDTRRAEALGGRGAIVHSSLAAALEHPADVVHVCTPLGSHAALCHQALAAGCHVIVEKPATPTATEAASLVAAAQAAGRLLVPVHQFVFQRGIQAMLARRAEFGVIRHFEFATASAGADVTGADRDGIAAEIVPHGLALARSLLDLRVGDLDWTLHRPAKGEWRFSAMTDREASISGWISLRARPTFAVCRVLGDEASATADLFHGFALFERGHASRRYKLIRPFAVGLRGTRLAAVNLLGRALQRERAYPGLRGLCAATYARIGSQGPPPFAPDEIVDVARARDRLIALAAR